MWVTTVASIIVIVFAYISQFKSKGKFFDIGFIIVTIIASIQYGYGTDYLSYYELWEVRYGSKDIGDLLANFFNQTDWTEPGWMLLNALFGFRNGFFILVALISVVENYVYYRLIRDYVPLKWRWFAVFLYLGLDSLYLLNFSMLRQGLCVSLFVAAVMIMNKRRLLPAIVVMLLALTIHLSSAICLPFIIIYFLPLKRTGVLAMMLLILTFIIFVFKDVVISILKLVYAMEELGKYSGYGSKTLGGVGIGYMIKMMPNIVILYSLFKNRLNSREFKVIALLAFCDILITPLQFYGADMAGRLGVYFIAFKVAAIPLVYGLIKGEGLRATLILIMVFITSYLYIQFFQDYSGGYQDGYRTIFSIL